MGNYIPKVLMEHYIQEVNPIFYTQIGILVKKRNTGLLCERSRVKVTNIPWGAKRLFMLLFQIFCIISCLFYARLSEKYEGSGSIKISQYNIFSNQSNHMYRVLDSILLNF